MSTYEDIAADAARDRSADAAELCGCGCGCEVDREFIYDRCGCEHDADQHSIVDDEDERGRFSWIECAACGGSCEGSR